MAFSPTTWVSGGAPGISAAELNRIEQGIEKVDGGVYLSTSLLNNATAPNVYDNNMMSMGIGSATLGFPNWSSVVTFMPTASDWFHASQLAFSAQANRIFWRRSANTGGTSWGSWFDVMHSGMDAAFTFGQNFEFTASTSQLRFTENATSASNRTRIVLDGTSVYQIGVRSSAVNNDLFMITSEKVTFFRSGYASHFAYFDFTIGGGPASGFGPVLTFSGQIGQKVRYYNDDAYVRGIEGSTLYDKTNGNYKVFHSTQTPASDTPRFHVDTSNDVVNHSGFRMPRMASGYYTGNGTGQSITVGFRPKFLILLSTSDTEMYMGIPALSGTDLFLMAFGATAPSSTTSISTTATEFQLVASSVATYPNRNTYTYAWIAFGE